MCSQFLFNENGKKNFYSKYQVCEYGHNTAKWNLKKTQERELNHYVEVDADMCYIHKNWYFSSYFLVFRFFILTSWIDNVTQHNQYKSHWNVQAIVSYGMSMRGSSYHMCGDVKRDIANMLMA